MWSINRAGGSAVLYADPNGVVANLREWLPMQQHVQRYSPLAYKEQPSTYLRPAAPVVISGLVKVRAQWRGHGLERSPECLSKVEALDRGCR